MAKRSNIVPIKPKDPGDALYEACAEFAEIRASLVLVSEVLNDSAFNGGNSISEERDVSAVLVLERAVGQLSELEFKLDGISATLNQPKAIAKLKADGVDVSHG